MARITDIIEINITRETAAVAQTNFNVPLFIASFTNFKERAREYANLEAVAEDFDEESVVYTAATKFFGQTLRPNTVVIGRRQIPAATVVIDIVRNNAQYSMNVSDVEFSYTSDESATAAEIASGLVASYNITPVTGVTLQDQLDGSIRIESNVDWSLSVNEDMGVLESPAIESWLTTLEAVQSYNDRWYALTTETHQRDAVLDLAGAIEAKRKIYGVSSAATDIAEGDDSDLFSLLGSLGYQRTFGIYSPTADTEFPECALIGYQLQEQPGSTTWAYKTLAGTQVTKLSDSASQNVRAKNATTFETIGGLRVTVGGKMFGGEWIDVMVFVDWLEARMRERIWFRLANSKKISYTNGGGTILETEVRAQLREGIRVGGLAETPAPIVTVPDVLSIAPNLRAQRIFEGISFEARLAGAIHFVKIRGRVVI
ncbi:MAG: hypothetical protein CL573_00670 [Alphaproteobacteria bacterium]|nr:hypothetical protein [Alphaproteobacteria bacterium]|tara:strand:- start:1069 stop:2355 length:1287 start_codon:yes stop_codon:yes gene_type:complete